MQKDRPAHLQSYMHAHEESVLHTHLACTRAAGHWSMQVGPSLCLGLCPVHPPQTGPKMCSSLLCLCPVLVRLAQAWKKQRPAPSSQPGQQRRATLRACLGRLLRLASTAHRSAFCQKNTSRRVRRCFSSHTLLLTCILPQLQAS